MENSGMTFGIIGMTFAIIAWGLIANLKKELNDLKKRLEESGILKDQTESGNK